MRRSGKVFIDANMVIHAAAYQLADVFDWLNSLYDEIYIHQMVLEELQVNTVRQKVQDLIDNQQWVLFDPDDEEILSDAEYDLYEAYVHEIRQAFRELDEKKIKEGRPLKHTNDLGEMHSLAAAMLLNAQIICSNDYDIREVIEDTPLKITLNEEEDSILLQQDTLEDFCYYVSAFKIAKRSLVRKFFKMIQPNKIKQLDERLGDE